MTEENVVSVAEEEEEEEEQAIQSVDPVHGGSLYWIGRELVWGGVRQKYRVYESKEAMKGDPKSLILESYFTPFYPMYYMIITKDGEEFCRVRNMWLWNWRRFVLSFKDGQTVTLIDNNVRPYTDTIYNGEKLRFTGTSTTMHEHGVREFQLVKLQDQEMNMLDGMTCNVPHSPLLNNYNRLPYAVMRYLLGFHYDKATVDEIMNSELPRDHDKPVGKYHEFVWKDYAFMETVQHFLKDSVFLVSDRWNKQQKLVILCMVLVIKQQENERFKYQVHRLRKEKMYMRRPYEPGPYRYLPIGGYRRSR